jgi:hypothetical protein
MKHGERQVEAVLINNPAFNAACIGAREKISCRSATIQITERS